MEIKKLIDGFNNFHEKYYKVDDNLISTLKEGQCPGALVIACSDSRVDPAILLEAAPGDIFVVRNIANLVPPPESHVSVSAAVEYAVSLLDVSHIIILGHSQCGGIRALLDNKQIGSDGTLQKWMENACEARELVCDSLPNAFLDEQYRVCEQTSIILSLNNLMLYPSVRERVEEGTLMLLGWYFDIQAGKLLQLDPETYEFELLAGA
jgi:carbonic anhydrase